MQPVTIAFLKHLLYWEQSFAKCFKRQAGWKAAGKD